MDNNQGSNIPKSGGGRGHHGKGHYHHNGKNKAKRPETDARQVQEEPRTAEQQLQTEQQPNPERRKSGGGGRNKRRGGRYGKYNDRHRSNAGLDLEEYHEEQAELERLTEESSYEVDADCRAELDGEKFEGTAPAEPETAEPAVDVPRVNVIGIRFASGGKVYYFDPEGKQYKRGSHAIVETARGLEYGEVAIENTDVPESSTVPPLRPVIRAATAEDTAHFEDNRRREQLAIKTCVEKVAEFGLDMKLVDTQYTFDNSKLIVYFTAPGRVDFRELVRELASVFRTRIELRQIGIRDEARMFGSYGICGRKLCCAAFLPNFMQVSTHMAKMQGISLSSNKASGICGRLMCCLKYENDTYEEEIKKTPPQGAYVDTPDGRGNVTEIFPIAGKVKVRLADKPDIPPRQFMRDDVRVLRMPTEREDGKPAEGNDKTAKPAKTDKR